MKWILTSICDGSENMDLDQMNTDHYLFTFKRSENSYRECFQNRSAITFAFLMVIMNEALQPSF